MTEKQITQKQIVHIQCDVPGHAECWIKYDVTAWGIDVFTSAPFRSAAWLIRFFLQEHSIDWHMVGDDDAVVVHPGKGAAEETWTEVWRQIGPRTGRALFTWLGLSVLLAVGEATSLTPKSAADGGSTGAGA